MFVLRGTVMTMRSDERVLARGAVYVGDNGLIAAVTPLDDVPAGFADAPSFAAGGIICPGLIDLHNHLMYNSLPLWTEPSREVPWTSHNQWGRAPTYSAQISQPARLLGAAAGRALLRYVETRAIVGGTTSIQGNPRGAVPPDDDLIRNVDSEKLGTRDDFIRVSTLVADSKEALAPYAAAVAAGRGFIAHSAEGSDPKLRAEFQLLDEVGVVKPQLVAIHGGALNAADFALMRAGGASLVWSPFSNYWLYGATADVAAAKAAGVRLCIGSDWAPSGTRNVLWELKVADLWNKAQPAPVFTDAELVALATRNPGEALSTVWPHPVGRIERGALADLIVVRRTHPDPYRNLINATEPDIRLAVVGGRPRYGLPSLMKPLAPTATPIRLGPLTRHIDYGTPTTTWPTILTTLNAVRTNPTTAAHQAAHSLTRAASALSVESDVVRADAGVLAEFDAFVLLPDMPAPELEVAVRRRGAAAAAPEPVEVPPIEPITTGAEWCDAVDANPFHGGLLSGLRTYLK
ncbi:amidohydrolase family protein [Kribbella sandramycini]|uniref:Amidohydrolase family protein n=1 Tax=Kribbella sandramycini TaxID=60450 RepID=A0A7Y4KV39_9ACTN|nr:amidohydrolase family protein [Kribbella sandramycini]MBB6568189.1 cytosine/adenosine deaminase-related metal-dependent hydrolase [Kribbella sandramycini]NOL39217.1 amidohydrolase family protein [Kribbella sandramycini]